MAAPLKFVDIHCHLIPGIDDGAGDYDAAVAMAKLAVADGIETIIATPHQLGSFAVNQGGEIRRRVEQLQQRLQSLGVELNVLPGADVRIEDGMVEAIAAGNVLTLADQRKHVLLELPHELYFPLETLLDELRRRGLVGVLSHPERNAGVLQRPQILSQLVASGCLMQVTAGSLCGTFGPRCQQLAEWMLARGLVHFVATDAHGPRTRRPIMSRAFHRVSELAGATTATELCCEFPRLAARGFDVPTGPRLAARNGLQGLFRRKKAS